MLTTHTRLAVELGLSRQTVGKRVKVCTEELGLLTVTQKRAAGSYVVRPRRLTKTASDFAWVCRELVTDVMRGEDAQSVAGWLLAIGVTHPAFTYNVGGVDAWLVCLLDALHLDTTAYGITERSARRARKWLAEVGVEAGADLDTLRAKLDTHAGLSGAYDRKREAREAAREASQKRVEELAQIRRRRALVAPYIADMMKNKLTPATADEWCERAAEICAGIDAEEPRNFLRHRLAQVLTKAGLPAEKASQIAARSVPEMGAHSDAA